MATQGPSCPLAGSPQAFRRTGDTQPGQGREVRRCQSTTGGLDTPAQDALPELSSGVTKARRLGQLAAAAVPLHTANSASAHTPH